MATIATANTPMQSSQNVLALSSFPRHLGLPQSLSVFLAARLLLSMVMVAGNKDAALKTNEKGRVTLH